MRKKVLVAEDFQAPASWAVGYAVKLAARLRSPLVFMGVAPPGNTDPDGGSSLIPENLDEASRQRLESVVRQCQEEGVDLEIFLASGRFFQEISRLLESTKHFRFMVVGVPCSASARELEAFSGALKELRRLFPGEILLVREQGKLTRFSDLKPRQQGRKP